MRGQPKSLTINGTKYPLRYFTREPGGPLRAVLNVGNLSKMLGVVSPVGEVGPLQGKYGDEWPIEERADGTVVLPGGECGKVKS